MWNRLFVVACIVAAVGLVTNAFAQTAVDDARPINRAGAVALLVESSPIMKTRLEQRLHRVPPLPLFDDVDYSQWYAPYVETAFEFGIISGNADRLFRPANLLTQDEALVLAARLKALSSPGVGASLVSSTTHPYEMVLASARQSGITVPAQFVPANPVRRMDLYAMMQSAGVSGASTVAVTHAPTVGSVGGETGPVVAVAPVTQPSTGYKPTTGSQPRAPTVAAQPTIPARPTPTPTPTPTQPSSLPISTRGFGISMPSLGIRDLTISHPADPTSKDGLLAPLQRGVGHLFSYPGKGGTILIYGHSSSYPWDVSNYTKIFRQINKLAVGDRVYVSYDGKVHIYQVTNKQAVPAGDMSAYRGGNGEELILYTCWPPDSISQRYLVHARPVEVVAMQ